MSLRCRGLGLSGIGIGVGEWEWGHKGRAAGGCCLSIMLASCFVQCRMMSTAGERVPATPPQKQPQRSGWLSPGASPIDESPTTNNNCLKATVVAYECEKATASICRFLSYLPSYLNTIRSTPPTPLLRSQTCPEVVWLCIGVLVLDGHANLVSQYYNTSICSPKRTPPNLLCMSASCLLSGILSGRRRKHTGIQNR